MQIRPLTETDAGAWREFRTRMLAEHPDAFGEAAQDHAKRTEAELCQRIREGNLIGAWLNGKLAGTVGWKGNVGAKRKHLAEIWGMYVAPEARRTGTGRALLRAVYEASAAKGATRWGLAVEQNNTAALKLYESEGFVAWGVEPDAYRPGGRSINSIHMSRTVT